MMEIKIGIIVNTHGLRGEVKIKPTTDFADIRFAKGKLVHLHKAETSLSLKVQYAKAYKQLLIVKFEGYEDINQVETWKGCTLYVEETELHELAEDEAYFYELKGCRVEDEAGTFLGEVDEVMETNANAILRVKSEEREFLVPYVKAFIVDFDRSAKRIILRVMDGLL